MSRQLSQEVHLLDYFQVIRKRTFVVLACILVIFTSVAIATYVEKPSYETIARIIIEEELRKSPVTGLTMEYDSQIQTLEFATQLWLITSYPVLERVFNTLPSNKEKKEAITNVNIVKKAILFIRALLTKAKRFIRDLFPSWQRKVDPMTNDPYLLRHYKIQSLMNKIEVQQVKNTRVVDLKATDTDPKLAMNIANTFAQAYIEYTRSSSAEATKGAIAWLTIQLDDIKKEILKSEKSFFEYKLKEGIFSIKGKEDIHAQRIANLTSAYTNCKSKRLSKSAVIRELKGILDENEYYKVTRLSTVNSQLVDTLYRELVNEELKLSKLKRMLKPTHPDITIVESNIESIRKKFNSELKSIISTLNSECAILKDEERTLLSSIQQNESEVLNFSKNEMQYSMLEREVETNKGLYNLLLSSFNEANLIKAMHTTNVRLIKAAAYPLKPAKPRKAFNLLLGFSLGLMVGVGLSLFLEYLDCTISTPEDVNRCLGFPILTAIPKLQGKELRERKSV